MHGSSPSMLGWPAPSPEMAVYLHEKGVKTIRIDAPSIGSVSRWGPLSTRKG